MDLRNKRVLVAGTGISGIGAAGLLWKVGACVILYDSNDQLDHEEIRGRFESVDGELTIITGMLTGEVIQFLDLCVLSPGIPTDVSFVCQLRAGGVKLWGEVELAYHYSRGTIAAITGTNGKTTTTALTGEILRAYTDSVYVVGNIGNSYTGAALLTREDSMIVAEMSSFQLETIDMFHPKVSAVLNITPDHLDRHHTMEGYIGAKMRVFENQTADDYTVLNYDDEVTRAMAAKTRGQVIFFSSTQELIDGYYFKDKEIFYAAAGERSHICYASDLKIPGRHNMENIMAAIAITCCLGVPMSIIFNILKTFMGVEHRIEYVTERRGVVYYNDSKGTNTDAAIKAVQAMNRPTLLIGGGYDKHGEYDEWIEAFNGKIRYLVLIGQTTEAIERCARKHGFSAVIRARDLAEAVHICAKNARAGDAVLLSPACASWGMFKNYEERGRLFKEYVQQLED